MTEGEPRATAFRASSQLLTTGAVLAGVGSLLGLAGLTVTLAALTGAARRWVNAAQQPPRQLARQQWAKARAATAAGARTWRNGPAEPVSDPA